MEIEGF